MNEPHRITLRPPWSAESLPDGRTRHTRRFGRPRTLGAGEAVWVVGAVPTGAEVRLNGQLLGVTGEGGFAFEVTVVLEPRNELAIAATGDIGPVAVEVRVG